MKNLDLNGLGVQEMNAEEMNVTDGGFWQFVAGAIVGGIIYDAVKAAAIAVYNSPSSQAMINNGYISSPLR